MKYQNLKTPVKQELRATVNERILIEIAQASDLITKEEMFNAYTGKGKLHGLKFNSYECFYDYTSAKQEFEAGEFYTPFGIAQLISEIVNPVGRVLDPTSGKGMFANFVDETEFTGIELDGDGCTVANHLFPAANIVNCDIRYWDNGGNKFDYILTNPPFNLRWEYNDESCSSQYYILASAVEWLREYGIFAAVVPLTYLQDEMYFKRDIEVINENFAWLGQVALPMEAFQGYYDIRFATKVIFFQKKTGAKFSTAFNTWQHIEHQLNQSSQDRKANLLKVVQSEKGQNDYSFTDGLRSKNGGFQFQVKKLLYEIKVQRPPKDRVKYYTKGLEVLKRYNEEVKPPSLEWKEWDKIRLTEAKVLNLLRQYAGYRKRKRKKQVSPPAEAIQVLDFDYVAPTPEIKKAVSVFTFINKLGTHHLTELQQYDLSRLLMKKHASLNYDTGTGKTAMCYAACRIRNRKINIILAPALAINLTWRPHLEMNGESWKFIKKPSDIDYNVNYWLISSDGLALGDFKSVFSANVWLGSKDKKGKKVFVKREISRANIQVAEQAFFKQYGAENIAHPCNLFTGVFNSEGEKIYSKKLALLCDLKEHDHLLERAIKKDRIKVTNTFSLAIKKALRQIRNDVQFILDESDELGNRQSNRYRSARTAFTYCKNKLIATATGTRNVAYEIYSQYELLYNNSMNMVDNCRIIYRQEKVRGEKPVIKELLNNNYGNRFHPYKGLAQFKRCFSPYKKSVFGIEKHDQDLYNYEELLSILKYTSIVRTFEEVCGKKHEPIHKRFDASLEERELYNVILKEFQSICYQHFNNSGKARIESGQRLLRQLRLLIKATSMPQSFSSYTSEGSAKQTAILETITERNEKIILGCLTKQAAKHYFNVIQEKYLRPVWYIDGNITYNKRQKILKEFEATPNGIIICTQQSLKSSINVPTCNLVLIEAIYWNYSKIKQFFARVVRFDSKEMTDVIYFTLAETIDDNLLALIMAKERINKAVKHDKKEQDEVFKEFGFDADLLNSLMSVELDDDTERLEINWGKQKRVS